MIVGSVCSGIGGFELAQPGGWQTAFVSEIAPFPAAVLAQHFPEIPNLGDMTRYQDWPDAALDVLVGGTPCQSFSVAGLRGGLADPRGNLALVFLGLVDRYRPRWVVWENVPGVRSADRGGALGSFLGGLEELGYGWAYRTLDAQYFGLAQRRKRVFVVGHSGGWAGAGAVLFDAASVPGYPAPRRETRHHPGPGAGGGATPGGGAMIPEVAGTLGSATGGFRSTAVDGMGAWIPEIVPQAMSAKWAKGSSGPAGDEVANLIVTHDWRVRKLTPRECERLQGFPDDWTAITWKKKPAPDTRRYHALGNAVAVPVARWILDRVDRVERVLANRGGLCDAA